MQHNFFYAKSLVHSRYNYENIKTYWSILKESVRVGRCREKFTMPDD